MKKAMQNELGTLHSHLLNENKFSGIQVSDLYIFAVKTPNTDLSI